MCSLNKQSKTPYFLTILEAASPRSRCQQIVSFKASLLGFLLTVSSQALSPVHTHLQCPSKFPLLISTPVRLGQGTPHGPHFNVITYLQTQSCSEELRVRVSTYEFGGTQFSLQHTPWGLMGEGSG